MRKIKLHRRAAKFFRRMPRDRQQQMIADLEEVAALTDIAEPAEQILYVDYIGPRGDAYRAK